MLDPLDFENRPFLDALARRRRITYFVLLIERISLHFWRPFFWILLFFGLWMLEIPQFFGIAGKFTAFFGFILGLVLFIRRDTSRFSFPDQTAIDRRIERQSSFSLGHISSIDDKIANPKKHKTRDLWEYFEQQVVRTFLRLKSPRPRALLTRRDPYALRFVAILFFLSGFWVSGAEWDRRIWEGLMPVPNTLFGAMPNNINLWVKPPEYTGIPQIYITEGGTLETPLVIPEGSEIKVRINSYFGKFAPPTLKMAGNWVSLDYLGEGLYGIETVIEEGGSLRINQLFIPRAKWTYTYISDLPPEIRIATKEVDEKGSKDKNKKTDPDKESAKTKTEEKKPYDILPGGQIRFPLVVKDDYGVTNVTVKMNLDEMITDRPLGKPFDETRLVMSPPATEFKIDPPYDLAWHTWAGLPVVFEFEAFDHKGQSTKLDPVTLVLPERSFEHPMAKSLIAMRKELAWNYDEDFLEIAANLEALLEAPDFFQNDPVIYLAIRTAAARLTLSNDMKQEPRQKSAEAIISLLWDTAISIEDGNLSLAMRDLREAQMALQDALRNPDTPPEEIQRLMDNLREKMANYFLEMQREIQKRMAEGEEFPEMSPENFEQFISPDALAKLMDQMESEMRSGNKESAQEMLSQLQRMMDMMDPSMTMQMPSDMQMMSKGINELQELIEKQENLKEQTEKQAKEKFVEDGASSEHAPQIPRDKKALEELDIGELPPPPKPQEQQKESPKQGEKAESKEQQQSSPSGEEKQSSAQNEGKPESEQQGNQGKPQGSQQNGGDKGGKDEGSHAMQQQGDGKKIPSPSDNADSPDKSAAAGQPDKEGTPQTESGNSDGEQKALRYVLGKLMQEAGEKLDEIPESMGKAEQEMRGSEQKLGEEEFSDSLPHQEQAIEHLKESQQQLSKQMQARMQQMVGIGMGGNGQKYDPLGRPYGGEEKNSGNPHGSTVKVPDEAQKKKVEEILKLLRERSGELERPQEELEYFRRLLRQF